MSRMQNHGDRWTAMALAGLVAAGLGASPSAAQFVGVEAEIQDITIGGTPHAIVEVFAKFGAPTSTVLNVYSANVSLVGAPGYIHNDLAGATWGPQFSLPPNDPNPPDSLVRIGGPVGNFSNTTQADPNWELQGFNQPGIPPLAGWFNFNPPNQQGLAGPSLRVPIMRDL